MQRCPASSLTSCTRDCWALKLGWPSMIFFAQQNELLEGQSSLHAIWSSFFQRPCSIRTWCMPLGWFVNSGWSDGKFISWRNLMPSCINHLFCMCACLPPGWKLIWETRSTFLEYVRWPCELSTRMRAWYLGPWRHSKVGIILLWSWIEIDKIKLKLLCCNYLFLTSNSTACFLNNKLALITNT